MGPAADIARGRAGAPVRRRLGRAAGIGHDAGYVARHITGRETLTGRVDSEDRMVRRDTAELGVR